MFSFTLRSFPRLDFILQYYPLNSETLEQIAWEHHRVFIAGRPQGQAVSKELHRESWAFLGTGACTRWSFMFTPSPFSLRMLKHTLHPKQPREFTCPLRQQQHLSSGEENRLSCFMSSVQNPAISELICKPYSEFLRSCQSPLYIVQEERPLLTSEHHLQQYFLSPRQFNPDTGPYSPWASAMFGGLIC